MEFNNIVLREISWRILEFLSSHEPMKAEDIAKNLKLNTRQVDAAVTKSLVRYGFCFREAKLTRLLKKEFNLIKITNKGIAYVKWRLKQEES